MGAQGPMRPGSFPGGPPGSMYGHPGMNMGSGMQGQQMGSYGGMRPMGMGQYNSQMGPGYMPGPGGQVKKFLFIRTFRTKLDSELLFTQFKFYIKHLKKVNGRNEFFYSFHLLPFRKTCYLFFT